MDNLDHSVRRRQKTADPSLSHRPDPGQKLGASSSFRTCIRWNAKWWLYKTTLKRKREPHPRVARSFNNFLVHRYFCYIELGQTKDFWSTEDGVMGVDNELIQAINSALERVWAGWASGSKLPTEKGAWKVQTSLLPNLFSNNYVLFWPIIFVGIQCTEPCTGNGKFLEKALDPIIGSCDLY